MAAPHEQSVPELSADAVVDPVGPDPLAAVPQVHIEWSDIPPQPTWQDHQQQGDEAYARAQELEKLRGLDPDTVAAYREASVNLLSASAFEPSENGTWWGPAPANPVRLLKIAGSLAKQAQAPEVKPYEETYRNDKGEVIDRREYMQEVAKVTLQRASIQLMGEDHAALAIAGELDSVNPSEVVVAAAIEAAKETGTGKKVFGPNVIDEEAPKTLEAGGRKAVLGFIGRNAMAGRQGNKFMAAMVDTVVEEITGVHKLPAVA